MLIVSFTSMKVVEDIDDGRDSEFVRLFETDLYWEGLASGDNFVD